MTPINDPFTPSPDDIRRVTQFRWPAPPAREPDPYESGGTPHLPASTHDPLTGAHHDPIGPGGVPLSETPAEALAFALGWIAARPVEAHQFGGVCALVEELMRRDARTIDGGDGKYDDPRDPKSGIQDGSLWNVLVCYMPVELARSLQALYIAHRGQRWAATNTRPASPR